MLVCFQLHPNNTSVCEGQDASFTCMISLKLGVPRHPSWVTNMTTIYNNSTHHDISASDNSSGSNPQPLWIDSTLTVINVTDADNGAKYLCSIFNHCSNPATLNVESK